MSQIFKFPINYRYGREAFSVGSGGVRTSASEINDNDYRTSSTQSRFILETHGNTTTTATKVTHIYIKGTGITTYTVSIPSGGGSGTPGINSQVIPSSGIINEVQHDLREMETDLSVTEVQVDITGTTTKVIEIMLLESVVDMPNAEYQAINPAKVDRGSVIRTNIRGQAIKTPGLAGRTKWNIDYTTLFRVSSNPSADQLLNAFEDNPNFTFAPSYSRWADRVYPATLTGGVDISYLGGIFGQRQLEYSIIEL